MTAIIHHADLYGKREDKYEELSKHTILTIKKKQIIPAEEFCFFVPKNEELQPEYYKFIKISDAMPTNSVGIVTARDHLCIQDTPEEVKKVVWDFVSLKPEQARKKYDLGDDARDWQVKLAQEDAKKSGPNKKNIVPILYRPFDLRYTYYTGKSRGFLCGPRPEVMGHMLAGVNLLLSIGRSGQVIGSDKWDILHCSFFLTEFNLFRRGGNNVFPFYLYPSSDDLFQTERKPNFTKEFLDLFASFKEQNSPLELPIFRYIYAVFHSPTYRGRYAEFLKIDFPRVPIPKTKEMFRELSNLGNDLIALHLLQEEDNELVTVSHLKKTRGIQIASPKEYKFKSSSKAKSEPIVDKGFPKYEKENVYINSSDYFESVPEEIWHFHIGGYQVLHKWLKDRRERTLSEEDILHYTKVIVSLGETIKIMQEVDEVLGKHGGFPDAFGAGEK